MGIWRAGFEMDFSAARGAEEMTSQFKTMA
jgi:hypothetical protein